MRLQGYGSSFLLRFSAQFDKYRWNPVKEESTAKSGTHYNGFQSCQFSAKEHPPTNQTCKSSSHGSKNFPNLNFPPNQKPPFSKTISYLDQSFPITAPWSIKKWNLGKSGQNKSPSFCEWRGKMWFLFENFELWQQFFSILFL